MDEIKQEEIYQLLLNTGYSTAYNYFRTKPLSIPYIIYTIPSEEYRGDDHGNSMVEQSCRVELYTLQKDLQAEEKLNKALNFTEFTKETIYIKSENMYMTIYEFELITKV